MRNQILTIALAGILSLTAFSDSEDVSKVRMGRFVPVCKVMNDAFIALAVAANTNLDSEHLVSNDTIIFNRAVGPFRSATIKKFNPPITFLDHNIIAGGQIEAIVATSIVVNTTFELCKLKLLNVKESFEKFKIDLVVSECSNAYEYGFATKRPTWGGWNICTSVRKQKDGVFLHYMTLFRKKPTSHLSGAVPLVDVDL